LGEELGRRLAHVGNLDCDVIATEPAGCARQLQVLDLNPRFGGGYPFSHVAGANLPAALIAWANREEPDPPLLRARPDMLASKGVCMIVSEHVPDSTGGDLQCQTVSAS